MTQATVRSWDVIAGGSAYLADGTVVILAPECLRDSVFRFLRPGQRVRVVQDSDGVAVSVSLP